MENIKKIVMQVDNSNDEAVHVTTEVDGVWFERTAPGEVETVLGLRDEIIEKLQNTPAWDGVNQLNLELEYVNFQSALEN